jgi:hypothetical protein
MIVRRSLNPGGCSSKKTFLKKKNLRKDWGNTYRDGGLRTGDIEKN